MRRVTETSLFNSALFYLRRYSSTEANLRRVMKRKVSRVKQDDPPPPEKVAAWLDQVIARLTRAGYLDDVRVATSRAAALQRAGKSARAVRQSLRQKGVPAPLAEELSKGHHDADAAWTAARKKRLGPYRSAERRADFRQKDLAALVRAGFPYGVAKRVIDAAEPPAGTSVLGA